MLGETKVFARATIQPPRMRTLLRLVWQAGTLAWIAGGVLLIAAPWMASDAARHWIIATLAVVFGFAAIANALATRAVHLGWIGDERGGGDGGRRILARPVFWVGRKEEEPMAGSDEDSAIENGVADVRLNRADKMNALDPDMFKASPRR